MNRLRIELIFLLCGVSGQGEGNDLTQMNPFQRGEDLGRELLCEFNAACFADDGDANLAWILNFVFDFSGKFP